MGKDFISTYDRDALQKEYEQLPAPKRLVGAIDVALSAAREAELPIKAGLVSRAWRSLTEKSRLRAAAWRIMHPSQTPVYTRLEKVQTGVGLSHMPFEAFCRHLLDEGEKFAVKCPKLGRHIAARAAEIDYQLSVASTHVQLDKIASTFQLHQHTLVTCASASDPTVAISLATTLTQEALTLVAATVSNVLGESGRKHEVDANIMLVVPKTEKYYAAIRNRFSGTRGFEAAEYLWRGLRTEEMHRRFFVAAQTRGDAPYLGFWLPDVRPQQTPLPGAPRAAFMGRPQAVHIDDLPPFPLQDGEIEQRWQKYLRGGQPGHFEGHLFVSIPVFAQTAGKTEVVAVVNVNIRDDTCWPRMYSERWLERASQLATPWAVTAWHSLAVSWLRSGTQGAGIKAGPMKKVLPTFNATMQLEEVNEPADGTGLGQQESDNGNEA